MSVKTYQLLLQVERKGASGAHRRGAHCAFHFRCGKQFCKIGHIHLTCACLALCLAKAAFLNLNDECHAGQGHEGVQRSLAVTTSVDFAELSSSEIAAYIETGWPVLCCMPQESRVTLIV